LNQYSGIESRARARALGFRVFGLIKTS